MCIPVWTSLNVTVQDGNCFDDVFSMNLKLLHGIIVTIVFIPNSRSDAFAGILIAVPPRGVTPVANVSQPFFVAFSKSTL
jgi:hypothetical protein